MRLRSYKLLSEATGGGGAARLPSYATDRKCSGGTFIPDKLRKRIFISSVSRSSRFGRWDRLQIRRGVLADIELSIQP